MEKQTASDWPFKLLVAVLGIVVILTLRPYDWNASAFFHMDKNLAQGNVLPQGFVVLSVPAYDGAQYYHVARNVPKMIDRTQWKFLRLEIPPSYAYQRFLLPLTAFLLAFGQTAFLPYSFLLINILSLIATGYLVLKKVKNPLYGLALALSPAALIGLHFTLGEPLTILLLTAFLIRWDDRKKIDTIGIGLLSLLVLTREVNVLFAGLVLVFLLFKREWKQASLILIPILVFTLFHGFLYVLFNDFPFLDSGAKRALPFQAIIPLLAGMRGYDRYTLSGIALFLCFVLPAILWIGYDLRKRKTTEFLPWATLAFLGLMITMPDFIWGSITSIGRVITPVYPLFLLYAARRDTMPARAIAAAILAMGLAIGFGLAFIAHPYVLT